MSNIVTMSHLGFERACDGSGDVIASFQMNGAPAKALLDHKHAVLALGDLLGALQIELRKEFAVQPLTVAPVAHGHPGEPDSPNPAPDA